MQVIPIGAGSSFRASNDSKMDYASFSGTQTTQRWPMLQFSSRESVLSFSLLIREWVEDRSLTNPAELQPPPPNFQPYYLRPAYRFKPTTVAPSDSVPGPSEGSPLADPLLVEPFSTGSEGTKWANSNPSLGSIEPDVSWIQHKIALWALVSDEVVDIEVDDACLMMSP